MHATAKRRYFWISKEGKTYHTKPSPFCRRCGKQNFNKEVMSIKSQIDISTFVMKPACTCANTSTKGKQSAVKSQSQLTVIMSNTAIGIPLKLFKEAKYIYIYNHVFLNINFKLLSAFQDQDDVSRECLGAPLCESITKNAICFPILNSHLKICIYSYVNARNLLS